MNNIKRTGVALLLLGCLGAPLVAVADDAVIARGKQLYGQICFTCHGPKLDGGIGPALADDFWLHGSSPEAILNTINKGIPNTEMIGYEAVFPEADRLALRDFILSEQEGMRETMRSSYSRNYFKGKRLTSDLFKGVESDSQTLLPENVFHAPRAFDSVYRGTAKIYLKEAADYRMVIRPIGRTTVLINSEEIHYSDDKADKKTHINKTVKLDAGVHDLEFLHEEKKNHAYRVHVVLERVGGKRHTLTGRGLEGNVPKVLKARPVARVARKWIADLPPRSLLCILPNQVIVAYNPVDNQILKAWHSADVNQTPSLDGRSQRQSDIRGTEIANLTAKLPAPKSMRFLHYETKGDTVRIGAIMDGVRKTVTISPKGPQSFDLSIN